MPVRVREFWHFFFSLHFSCKYTSFQQHRKLCKLLQFNNDDGMIHLTFIVHIRSENCCCHFPIIACGICWSEINRFVCSLVHVAFIVFCFHLCCTPISRCKHSIWSCALEINAQQTRVRNDLCVYLLIVEWRLPFLLVAFTPQCANERTSETINGTLFRYVFRFHITTDVNDDNTDENTRMHQLN